MFLSIQKTRQQISVNQSIYLSIRKTKDRIMKTFFFVACYSRDTKQPGCTHTWPKKYFMNNQALLTDGHTRVDYRIKIIDRNKAHGYICSNMRHRLSKSP